MFPKHSGPRETLIACSFGDMNVPHIDSDIDLCPSCVWSNYDIFIIVRDYLQIILYLYFIVAAGGFHIDSKNAEKIKSFELEKKHSEYEIVSFSHLCKRMSTS